MIMSWKWSANVIIRWWGNKLIKSLIKLVHLKIANHLRLSSDQSKSAADHMTTGGAREPFTTLITFGLPAHASELVLQFVYLRSERCPWFLLRGLLPLCLHPETPVAGPQWIEGLFGFSWWSRNSPGGSVLPAPSYHNALPFGNSF